jgi:hypothetical protein
MTVLGCQSTDVEFIVEPVVEFDLLLEVGQGPSGPAGAPGAGAAAFRHVQGSAASTWVINHNLGIEPQVEVMSPGSVRVNAEVIHVNLNQVQVLFAVPYAGFALLRP